MTKSVAAFALLLSSCATPVQQGPKVRVAIGGQTQLIYLPATLAARLGYYQDEGLDVELTDFPGGAKALEALMGGSADVVCGYFDHTVQMAAQGKPLRSFVALLRYPGLALVSGGAATSVADLKGANIAVSAPGSSTHMFLNHLLVRAGLTPDSVSAIGVGMSAGSVAAVESGKVAAAIMAEPAISQLSARKPGIRILADTRTAEGVRAAYGIDSYPAAVFYSTPRWIDANPELARRIARAQKRTLEWIAAHPSADIAAKMPEEFRGGDLAMYTRAIEAGRAMYSTDGRLTAEGAAAVVRVLGESMPAVRDAKIDASACFTNQFVD